jgi:hypothetical protein
MIKFITVVLLSLAFLGCTDPSAKQEHDHGTNEVYYTCSMHPQVKEDKPGKCPICHMNLTKIEIDNSSDTKPMGEDKTVNEVWMCKDFPDVTSDQEEECPIDGSRMIKKVIEPSAEIAKIRLRKAQLSHFRPAFFKVVPMKMVKKIRLLGSVMQSEEKESSIPARIDGRVEKVYVSSTGSFIQEDDLVLELYSPKLITAGEEYIIARTSYEKSKSKDFKDMYGQSEQRLEQWGIKPKQYEKWFQDKKVPKSIKIFSPSTGIVRERKAIAGKYFKEGENFFELSDLSEVWVELDVYESDSALIKNGQNIELSFSALPGEVITGNIDFVSPVLNPKTRTLKIRTTIRNTKGMLKPAMVGSGTLTVEIPGMPLIVPRSAIIDTGKRKVVWIKISEKDFRAKVVRSGYESEGFVEIKEGLMEGEEVVIEGSFLLDAQAQLFGGYEKMTSPKSESN